MLLFVNNINIADPSDERKNLQQYIELTEELMKKVGPVMFLSVLGVEEGRTTTTAILRFWTNEDHERAKLRFNAQMFHGAKIGVRDSKVTAARVQRAEVPDAVVLIFDGEAVVQMREVEYKPAWAYKSYGIAPSVSRICLPQLELKS